MADEALGPFDATLNQKISEWEKQVEDILVEMMQYRDRQGFAICVDVAPIVAAFNSVAQTLRLATKPNGKYLLKKGMTSDE